MHTKKLHLSTTLFALLTACDGDTDHGTAPTISDLALSPDEVVVGQQAMLSGSLLFEDLDADALVIEIEVAPRASPQ